MNDFKKKVVAFLQDAKIFARIVIRDVPKIRSYMKREIASLRLRDEAIRRLSVFAENNPIEAARNDSGFYIGDIYIFDRKETKVE